MIKAGNEKDEARTPASIELPEHELNNSAVYLRLPYNEQERKEAIELSNCDSNIRTTERQIQSLRHSIRQYSRSATQLRKRKTMLSAKYGKRNLEDDKKEAVKQIELLSKLPWVEQVVLADGVVSVRARKGMLKTVFNKRVVFFDGGGHEIEFMDPIVAEMPQYEMFLNLESIGRARMSNQSGTLSIRMVNREDVSSFVVGKTGMVHIPYQHWAAGGASSFGSWSGLCLGEYEKDLIEASKRGLADFFTELAAFLQTSGDEHAYHSKPIWALCIGKPEYNEFGLRMADKGETATTVRERSKRDFRTLTSASQLTNSPIAFSAGAVDRLAEAVIVDAGRAFRGTYDPFL